MKKLVLITLLSGCCWAHPLSWLAGTYHGVHEGACLEESWTDAGSELLGTTIWLEDGRVSLRELARIRPQKDGYHLDLWLIFSDGSGKHLQMDGRLEDSQKLVFRGKRLGRPESLTFWGKPGHNLRVELQKQDLTAFDLTSGSRPETPPQLQGDYILHTYLGDQVFADELRWSSDHSGRLTVPGKFESPLENVKAIPGGGVSFEIMVPEGKIPYRVRYLMHFEADWSQATGTLVKVDTGQTMGSFVAIRRQLPQ